MGGPLLALRASIARSPKRRQAAVAAGRRRQLALLRLRPAQPPVARRDAGRAEYLVFRGEGVHLVSEKANRFPGELPDLVHLQFRQRLSLHLVRHVANEQARVKPLQRAAMLDLQLLEDALRLAVFLVVEMAFAD